MQINENQFSSPNNYFINNEGNYKSQKSVENAFIYVYKYAAKKVLKMQGCKTCKKYL